MKKVMLRGLAIFMWIEAIVGVFVSLTIINTQENLPSASFIVFIMLISVFVFLGWLFWKISSKNNNINPSNDGSRRDKLDEVGQTTNTESFAKIILKNDREVPTGTLKDMKKYYSEIQMEGDLRILSDCVYLIKSTNNIETFISRYELAQRTALTLEQARLAGLRVPSNFTSSKELMNLKYEIVPKLLKDSYEKMISDALKLKTEKGQVNRFEKYYELLVDNEIFFNDFDEYFEIIGSLNVNIEKYKASNSGG